MDKKAHIIILTIKYDEHAVDFVNIYAPTKDKAQEQITFVKPYMILFIWQNILLL